MWKLAKQIISKSISFNIRYFHKVGARPLRGFSNVDVEYSCSNNGIDVAAVDNGASIARVGVFFRAGSRHEDVDYAGVVHMLRICAGLSTEYYSQFAIMRHVQELGANIQCISDREIISYVLTGSPAAVEELLPYLRAITTEQLFYPWEVQENYKRVKYELANRSYIQRSIDIFHKAAYRNGGLGNSIYMPKCQIGWIDSEVLMDYMRCHFVTSRCCVVGIGFDLKTLVDFAGTLEMPEGDCGTIESQFKGGVEIRNEKSGNLAYVCVGTEGGKSENIPEIMTYLILKLIYGSEGVLRPWGYNICGMMQEKISKHSYLAVKAFSTCYNESGIFGAIIAGSGNQVGEALPDILEVLRAGRVKCEDVERAKRRAARSIYIYLEDGLNYCLRLGWAILLSKRVFTPEQVIQTLENINEQQVNAAASKISSNEFSMASIGNLKNIPYLDELC